MRQRSASTVAIAFLISAFGAAARPALADPIVITSGSFGLHTSDPSFFTFRADDGSVFSGGSGNLTNLGEQFPFFNTWGHPGLPVDLSAHVTTGTIIEGFNTTFQGVTYPTLFWSGQLDFASGPATWPTSITPGVFTTVTAPFQMTGHLTAFSDRNFSTPPLFSVELAGSGTAALGVIPVGANGNPGDLDFVFSTEQAATPEPASLLLMSMGLAGVAVRRWRRKTSER